MTIGVPYRKSGGADANGNLYYNGQGVHDLNEEVEYKRFILNLDEELIQDIEDIVYELKKAGAEGFDVKTGKLKKMNKSLWAREIFMKAVNEYKAEKAREQSLIEKRNANNLKGNLENQIKKDILSHD